MEMFFSLLLLLEFSTLLTTAQYGGHIYFRSPLDYHSPCAYPKPKSNRTEFTIKCKLAFDHIKDHDVCDPGQTIELSYWTSIAETLQSVKPIHSNGKSLCYCDGKASLYKHNCWIRFGVAALDELVFPKFSIPQEFQEAKVLCGVNTVITDDPTEKFEKWNSTAITVFGNHFATLIRQQWTLDECDKHVVILVVKHRPRRLLHEKNHIVEAPMIFVSYGENLNVLLDEHERDNVKDIIGKVNKRLETSNQLSGAVSGLVSQLNLLFDHAYEHRNETQPNGSASVTALPLILLSLTAGFSVMMQF